VPVIAILVDLDGADEVGRRSAQECKLQKKTIGILNIYINYSLLTICTA
jgi:hypothetical protein